MATPYEWENVYSTDIKSIDTQHRMLFDALQSFHKAAERGEDAASLQPLLASLIFLTQQHFTYEERLLADNHFPEYEAHKKEHDMLIAKAVMLEKFVAEGKLGNTRQLCVFMKEWLVHHTVEMDQKYANFLIARGVK